MKKHQVILYLMAALGLVLLSIGIVVGTVGQSSVGRLILSLLLSNLGSAILFPILVSFTYDRLRERWMGDEIWRIFTELADAGILRIYKDRERSENPDNAEARLGQEFRRLSSGEVLVMGVSLRVFFNQMGPFYPDIITMLNNSQGAVSIKALISDFESPEVMNRGEIESKKTVRSHPPQIIRDIESTIASVAALVVDGPGSVTLRTYLEAAYCTVIIFPDKCYFSPNILSPIAPVRLPMIIFRRGSPSYNKLKQSFDYIWQRAKPVVDPTSSVKTLESDDLGMVSSTEATQQTSTSDRAEDSPSE